MDSHINPSHGGNSSSLDSLKPSVLATIIILLITLTISVSICFLLRCLNRCNHHSPLSPSSSSSSSDPLRFSSTQRVSPETERSSSALDSLPIFKFSSVTRRSSTSTSDCAVCLSKFEPEDRLRLLPLCCHAFHADCIDTWLGSNQTCPLCRSPLFASDSDPTKKALGGGEGDNSFRLEIGSISRRRRDDQVPESDDRHRSYSMGSFDYVVDDVESEISESNFDQTRKQEDAPAAAVAVTTSDYYNPTAFEASLAGEIGDEGSRSWLRDYVDRVSHGISFRASGSFFTGSSRRSEDMTVVDLEANRGAGEEISEICRWLSDM